MSRGMTLGRYTLIEQLAVGGMAEIWLAHMAGPEGFEKLLVIKKILPHLSQRSSFLNMFLNEARLAAQLNHPNIIQLYDLGKVDETYFIAMEYIFGRDLSEIGYKAKQKKLPIPIEFATKIISQVCEGLYYAHTKQDSLGNPLNIVHRDVSPHNVLVSFAGSVKILDFGIAKAANQYDQTQQGILKGKVSYMSPEQIWGDPIDARSDLFCLGAVFYELVTGSRLFTGENDMAILRKITEDEVTPPSQYNPDIPPDLEAIILRTLDKNPDTRYPNAWELQQDLNLLLKRLGSPTNIHMAQFLKELFDDEMDAERRYLQKKIEELVHAEVLPPIEEEETLVAFAGSHPLGHMEMELAAEDVISAELPLVMGEPFEQDNRNPWLEAQVQEPRRDAEEEAEKLRWDAEDLELSLPTSETQRPIQQDQPSIRIFAEETNPELALQTRIGQSHPDAEPAEAVTVSAHHSPSFSPDLLEPAVEPSQTPAHSSQQVSPLFQTIQQVEEQLPQSMLGLRSAPSPSASHAEAHRNASYVGPREGLSAPQRAHSPTPPPSPVPLTRVSKLEEEEPTPDSQAEATVASAAPAPPPELPTTPPPASPPAAFLSAPPAAAPPIASPEVSPPPTPSASSVLSAPPPSASSTSPATPPVLSPSGSQPLTSSPNTPLFVPMMSQPRRNGDIPLVLSLTPDIYQQLAQLAGHQQLTIPQVVQQLVSQALAYSGSSSDTHMPPCHSDVRSHRLAPTKKD